MFAAHVLSARRHGLLRLLKGQISHWLPLLLGLTLGSACAVLIVRELWYLALLAALLIPAAILLIRYPFVSVMLWLSIYPIVRGHASVVGTLAYWGFHRAAIPAALMLVVLANWFGLRRRWTVRYGIAELCMLYFLVLGIVNMLVLSEASPRAPIRFYDLVVVPFLMYWMVTQFAPDEKDLKHLARVAALVIMVQSAVSLISWFAPQVLPSHWLRVPGRTSGTFGSPHPYTVTMAFLSLLVLQYLLQLRPGWWRHTLLFVVVTGFFAVFFSFSRGSWLGQGLVLLALLVRYPRATASLTAGVVLLLGVLATTVFAKEATYTWNRLTTEHTVQDRIVIYDAALQMLNERPILGWGFGNYETYDERFKGRVGDVPAEIAADLSSHNAYLTLVVEMGLVGLFLYLFPVGWWLLQSVRAWRRLPQQGFLSRSWLLMLWLAQVQQIAVSSFTDMFGNQPFGTTLWWMVLGLIASLVGPYVGRTAQPAAVGDGGVHPRVAHQ